MPVALEDVRRLVAAETGLATLACTRIDGSAALSVVNAGLMPHPLTGAEVVGLVRVMVAQRRTVVLIVPSRIYGRP